MMNRNILNPMMWNSNPTPPIGAGIYWNPHLDLISLSSDGTNRITMSDKNLGATQVYNYGDELKQSNCGTYYQWGNNYGFPHTTTITTTTTRVDTTNYGPYYDSEIYRGQTNQNRWSVENGNLWGEKAGTISALRGPCPEGFHIPSHRSPGVWNTDVFYISQVMHEIFGGGEPLPTEVGDYLKMPRAGYIHNHAIIGVGGAISVWVSGLVREGASGGERSPIYPGSVSGASATNDALPIRPFCDISIQPDETWTTIFENEGGGIYHNPNLGVISIRASRTGRVITIADKNLGATQVWNPGDTLSEANCGKYYQRGNNHGFPGIGNTEEIIYNEEQFDPTNYGPYYYNDEFVKTSSNWSTVDNKNLWGDVANTVTARRGPCPEGFHVPVSQKYSGGPTTGYSWKEVREIMNTLGIGDRDIESYCTYLKLPLAGYRDNSSASIDDMGRYGFYYCSNAATTQQAALTFQLVGRVGFTQAVQRSFGLNIRPFKNAPVAPDNSRTKLF